MVKSLMGIELLFPYMALSNAHPCMLPCIAIR